MRQDTTKKKELFDGVGNFSIFLTIFLCMENKKHEKHEKTLWIYCEKGKKGN